MKILHSTNEIIKIRQKIADQVGFVPTMGNLHVGHRSLITRSVHENKITVVSIFVNKLQFNKAEDFEKYPKTLEEDLKLCEEIGVDYVFIPQDDDIHRNKHFIVESNHPTLKMMEGKYRQGHFTGVLTVVLKLLQLAQPHKAYFGEKDYQQLLLVREMAKAFFLNCEIVPCETIRIASGVPYSSRNSRLNVEEMKIAEDVIKLFHGANDVEEKRELISKVKGITLEYLEAHEGREFIAFVIKGVRLIDNIKLN